MKQAKTALHIRGLELLVNLGWTMTERSKKQKVWLDLYMQFQSVPKACLTDHLKDTVCYDTLAKNLQAALAKRSFHLIERLGFVIYEWITAEMPAKTKVLVTLIKHPKMKKLRGDVCFQYGEE